MATEASTRPLTVEEAIRMAEVGIIHEGERVELVDGRLVQMTPEGLDHADVMRELIWRITRAYPEGFRVSSQSTLPLSELTYLEPDLYVVKAPSRLRDWPSPRQVVLVVEVAVTSAARYRTEKSRLFAAWGAPVYWVFDLTRREVLVQEEPTPAGYATTSVVDEAGALRLPGTDAVLAVGEVLPPRSES